MNNRFKFRLPFYDNKGTFTHFQYFDIIRGLEAYNAGVMYHNDEYEQCTGLKDKNGNLIYEGDIVRCSDGNIYNICWSDTAMIMIVVNTTTKIGDAIYKLKCYDEFEVIGNIHEQKEQQ